MSPIAIDRFSETLPNLLTKFLRGRAHYAGIGDLKCATLELKIGIPQELVLSPLLLKKLVNDIFKIVSSC